MYPENIKCIFCAEELNNKEYNCTCEDCLNFLPFITNPCSRCGSQLQEEEVGVCFRCKTKNYYFKQVKSIFEYKDLPLKVVHNFKYNKKKYLAKYMAKYLLDAYGSWDVFADFVTSVPMFNIKEKQRGFNQSKLLAESFAEEAKVPYVDFCEKVVDTPSQTSLNTKERIENVRDSFKIKSENIKLIKDKVILIIDDIVTTGATTSEISRVLLNAGAKECFVMSFAHTVMLPIESEASNNSKQLLD